jgi:hypothetical protein
MADKATEPVLPKVLQCNDTESQYYGFVATVGTGRNSDMYFVGSGANGGGWETAAFVDGWVELKIP